MSRSSHQASLPPEDVRLLHPLEVELPRLRKEVELARVIARFPRAGKCQNAALAFGFNHAVPAIVESRLLRLAEAVDPFLERVSQAVLGKSLFTGKGRKRRPSDDDLHLLLELRSKRVAHRVKLKAAGDETFKEVEKRHGDIFSFLLVVHDRVAVILAALA